MSKRIIPLLAVLAALFWSRSAEASHFRYGTIAWTVADPQSAPLLVTFTVTAAWRANSIGTTLLNFGDGANNGLGTGVAIGGGTDTVGNPYTVQQYKATHLYASAGTYTAFFQSSARIAGLVNGGGASYRVESKVGLTAGNTGGPVSAAPAIIQMQVGDVRTYTFPAFDPDGDAVTCRFATSAEMWSSDLVSDGPIPPASQNMPVEPVGNKQPTLTNTPAGCVVTWDLTQAAPGKQYVLHLVLESSHGGQLSSTSVDLIIETAGPPPPLCDGSGTFIANINQVFSTSTTGTLPGGGPLVLSAINAPAGSVITPPSGTQGASPYTNVFTWTPTAAFSGTTQIVLMSYTNPANNITGTCFLTLQVPQCANFGEACSVGVGECNQAGTNVCAGPGLTLCNAVAGAPSAELCDGKDNDCDGATDDGSPGSGVSCASGQPGVCSPGTTACTGGALVCNPNITPGSQMEVCDGQDNDCNGATDEGNPGGGFLCASGFPGICAAGSTLCTEGLIVCMANIAPGSQMEACDGDDNDCDGAVDDGDPGGGVACMSGLLGVCAAGTTACDGGAITCNAGIMPGSLPETCDSQDNDCDGNVDEGFVLGAVCSVGLGTCTAAGVIACDAMGGASCSAIPGAPVPEVCSDFLDNDCDGTTNNGCLDADGDGLFDDYEALIGTDPQDADSDDDGVTDGKEPSLTVDSDGDGLINALDPDSDDDGLFDGTELGKDCSNPATNLGKMACIADGDLGGTKTHPLESDTDGGSVEDGIEDANHNGQLDAGETDPNDPADDVPPGCKADSECGATDSGKVCDDATHACTDGCRGMGGNGCPDGKVCTSKTAAIGTCTDGAGGAGGGTSSTASTGSTAGSGGTGGAGGAGGSGGVGGTPERIVASGNGIFCSATPGSGDDEGTSWLLGGALAALVGARRRRRAA